MGAIGEGTLEAFYPAVAVLYFALVAWGTRQNKLRLDGRASAIVATVFLVGQVVCRALGGVTGFMAFAITAYLSYQILPRVEGPKERGGGEKKPRGQGHKSNNPAASSEKKAKTEGKRQEESKKRA
ncbi:uncharacterized protein LOC142931123 [Petromyzon marinus]|uniref:uncharacterized protein LOC142931123 n=1 Tax=Petromyzon marinus TaxID=7757 RepID=UPI003F70482D